MPASPHFADVSSGYLPSIEAKLQEYCQFDLHCPEVLGAAIRHSLLAPGKRLRPLLTLMAAEACGSDPGVALPAACAVEMVHAYSLVHDDLPAMDDDDLRRGRPTCHKVYGEANAILAGDALLTLAFEVLARDVSPPKAAVRCCQLLARGAGASGMVGGQVDDLEAETQENWGASELENIHRRKTGAMLEVSLLLGGTVADADEKELAALGRYGRSLGLAFQVVDDLLDHLGDEAALGKRTGKDTERGKLTYPGLLGVEASQQKASDLVAEAIEAAKEFGGRAEALVSLAQFVLQRKR